jgi:hypothetical protein
VRFLIAAFLLAAGAPAAQAESGTWTFRVLLDGRDVGRHHYILQGNGADQELRSEARYDVRILSLSIYRYVHEAVERWNGDCLTSLASHTETNGKRQSVNATTRGGRLAVERPAGRDEHEGCIMSFAYWNPRILGESRLLNSQTGELTPVTMTRQGPETLLVRGQRLAAQRHRISGPELQVDLWYAGDRWIALEALIKGGRRLRYELM